MAQLPPDGEWLIQLLDSIQQLDSTVILFHRHTQEEIVWFDPGNWDATARAQQIIAATDRLTPEQKSFAHFWSGYFYAHAPAGPDCPRQAD